MAGFLIGYLVAYLAKHNGEKYTNNEAISAAPAGQFLWVRTESSRSYLFSCDFEN